MKHLHCNTFIILLSSLSILFSAENAQKGAIGSARKLGQCWKSLHGKKPNSNSSSSSPQELVKSGIGNNFPGDSSFNISDVSEQDLPPSFDYRTQAVVGRVKEDQKSEAPYASAVFASIAALEASYMLLMRGTEGKLAPGQLVHFSEQDTVNCLLKFGYREAAQEATYSSGFEHIVLGELYGSGSKRLVGIKLESDAPPYNLNQVKMLFFNLFLKFYTNFVFVLFSLIVNCATTAIAHKRWLRWCRLLNSRRWKINRKSRRCPP